MICGFPTPTGPCRRLSPGNARYCYLHEEATAQKKVEAANIQLAALGDALLSNGVVFALIGGAALGLYGAPVEATRDVDVLVDRDPENLTRLAVALNQIDARIWISPTEEPIATTWTKELLAAHQRFVNLVTNEGPLDINYSPDGLEAGFALIADRIVTIGVRDIQMPVAPLEAIVASKTAAGRPKDVQAVAKIRRWLTTRKDGGTGSNL
jgi:hypothetical protein